MVFGFLRKADRADRAEWLDTLANHAGVGLWDAVLHDGDAAHPKARWTWSPEFRRLCGFSSEAEFPNVMASWSDRLHPEDAPNVFETFNASLATGRGYDVAYRLKVKSGEYRWFRATGGVVRDRNGQSRRACGSLVDVNDARLRQQEQQDAVEQLGTAMRQLAGGDLTIKLGADFPNGLVALKTDFNRAVEELRQSIAAVSESSEGIETGAREIRQASGDLASRTEQQAANLEKTAAAMDRINAMVQQTAENTVKVNGVVVETKGDAQQSGAIVQQTVAAMSGIERASNEISEIISVIDGISFQTNLLALNAGVEAARAGEAGRGFAVVASEVRALAQRSADAANDVKTRILACTNQVAAGVDLVDKTGKSLERIIARVNEISELTGTIAAAAEQQAGGLRQVHSAISQMDVATQQNAAMVEEATAAASSLADEATQLASNVGRFQLTGGRAGNPVGNMVQHLQARIRG